MTVIGFTARLRVPAAGLVLILAVAACAVAPPTLPIGGSADNSDAVRQCVDVNWREPSIVDGVTVAVTGIGFATPHLFTLVRGPSCGDSPNCAASFSFSPSQTHCSLAVLATGTTGHSTDVIMAGVARCTPAQRTWCDNLEKIKGNTGETVTVTQPSTSSSSSTSSSESSSSSSTSSSSSPTPSS